MSLDFNLIRHILSETIPVNESGADVILTLGESLLLAIEACKKANLDQEILTQLNQLYLEGIKSETGKTFVKKLKAFFRSKNFVITSTPTLINNDPSRRYFETSLAYHILQTNAELLDHNSLCKFKQNLKRRLYSTQGIDYKQIRKIEKILNGEIDEKELNKYELEYAELTHRLLKNDYYGLSEKACKNLYEIACSTILATLNTQVDKALPANIYHDSIFTMGMDGRGRMIKPSNNAVRTTAKGLLKATSPLPLYDKIVNPEEEYTDSTGHKRTKPSLFLRSADQANFMIESQWSQHLFSRQTQIYSNGISSTTLAQIRNLILQKRQGNPYFCEAFQEYMTTFAALMLYNSGGHSFFEIFEVFKLGVSRELFPPESMAFQALSDDTLMYQWLCEMQQACFEAALQSTFKYTHAILNKKILNAEFLKIQKKQSEHPVSSNQSDLHSAVLNTEPHEFAAFIKDLRDDQINELNYKKWTPLMVASRLGKSAHVKQLLAKGAKINKRVCGLSALELAIKSEDFDTVEALIIAGASIKRTNKPKFRLKVRSPALYLACRQSNLKILQLLLDNEQQLNIEDKIKALIVAVRVENIEALEEIFNRISRHEKLKYFTDKFKIQLLKEAVNLGNICLIQSLMQYMVDPDYDCIQFEPLLNKAATNGFLPVANYLLTLSQDVQQDQDKINLNDALTSAIKNSHFEMAMFLIIEGADPGHISTSLPTLREFNQYLESEETFTLLFTGYDLDKISKRANEIAHCLDERENSLLHGTFKNIVNFLNRFLPDSWRLGYNDKTHALSDLAQLLKGDKPCQEQQEAIALEDTSVQSTDDLTSTVDDATTRPGFWGHFGSLFQRPISEPTQHEAEERQLHTKYSYTYQHTP